MDHVGIAPERGLAQWRATLRIRRVDLDDERINVVLERVKDASIHWMSTVQWKIKPGSGEGPPGAGAVAGRGGGRRAR